MDGTPSDGMNEKWDATLDYVSNLHKENAERDRVDGADDDATCRHAPHWPMLEAAAALHGLAGEFVNLTAPHTEADNAALLIQFLAAFGNAVGKAPCRAPDGTIHHMNLFALLAGSSSKARKGSSWASVKRFFERVDRDWSGERVQAGLSSGEGLIWAVRDPIVKHEPFAKKAA